MSMKTFSEDEGPFTVVLIWTADTGGNRKQLVEVMRTQSGWMAGKAGFRSLAVHDAPDARQVIVVVQWEDRAAFEAAITGNPQDEASRRVASQWGTLLSATLCHTVADLTPEDPSR
jgi:heme-degrading monooxygenase HmoA